jgi:hypothetical protein
MMTLDEFVRMQRAFISENGSDFLPTVVIDTDASIVVNVLSDVPAGVDEESFARDWVLNLVDRERDFYLVVKMDEDHFKVMCRRNGVIDAQIVSIIE